MQSRRDQAQAYRFVLNRLQSALLQGEPDAPEPPLRRVGVATFASVMVAVLVVAGFGVVGLLRPGGKQGWRQAGILVVERETGTRFVYDPADDALHPVLNYASARLILNAPNVEVRFFSRRSLAEAPRGAARGLPNLPDALPAASGLIRGPWIICSRQSSGSAPSVTVSVGFAAGGGPIGSGRALLIRGSAGKQYLIWNDTRLEIATPTAALAALGFDTTAPIDVADTWVNSVPPGPDLAAPAVPGLGQLSSYQVAGGKARVGEVLKVPAEGGVQERYRLVLADGLAPITHTAALLLLGDPGERQAYGGASPTPTPVGSADVNAAPHSLARVTPDGFPDQVPALANPPLGGPQAVCAAYPDTAGTSTAVTVSLAADAPGVRPGSPAGAGGDGRLLLPPGRAAVIRLLPHPDQGSDSIYLVTDTGAKYPVPSGDVLTVLGYGGVSPVPVPSGVVGLIPTGPALDPTRANADVAVPAAAPAGARPVPPARDGGA